MSQAALGLVMGWAATGVRAGVQAPASPDEVYGALYADVERAQVFADQKTFADCVPREPAARIVAEYAAQKAAPDLGEFVRKHFLVPAPTASSISQAPSLSAHLTSLWSALTRVPDPVVPGSSLLPLPHAYVVPGGRFREVYYWDSYFTMLGLRESGREDLIRSMVDNFAYEIATYGHIPNGNRTYYLSRSQPPFFALMVELLAEKDGVSVYQAYHQALRAEYAYWMDETDHGDHVVRLPDGGVLNRYRDQRDTPRAEAFRADEALATSSAEPAPQLYRNLRSAAESGWDFSSRWLSDGRSLGTIRTIELIPVDLNCLLFQLETTLAKACAADGDAAGHATFSQAAARRKAEILSYCWSEADGFFFDYDVKAGQRSPAWTLAGLTPLFLGLATDTQADAVSREVGRRFLRPGGVVTTLMNTGQQWDAPNGWAPLEWMTVAGLRRYGHAPLASSIAHRWIDLNRQVYARTGKMMEKYDVEDTDRLGGGGEYPSQDGFGWTNGVLLALMRLYPEPNG